jgi:hypothetical protein
MHRLVVLFIFYRPTPGTDRQRTSYIRNTSLTSSSCCGHDSDIRFYDLLVQSPLKFQWGILKIRTYNFSFRIQTSQNDPFLHILTPDGLPYVHGSSFQWIYVLTNKLLSPATLIPSLQTSEL